MSQDDNLLKVVARNERILKALYSLYESTTVSKLAIKMGVNASTTSRGIMELEALPNKIIEVNLQPRPGGGKPEKYVKLSDSGRSAIGSLLFATESIIPEGKSVETPIDALEFALAKLQGKPKPTTEAEEAAWRELRRLAQNTRLWMHDKFWVFIDSFIVSGPLQGPRARDALDLLRMLGYRAAKDEPDLKKNPVAIRVRSKYVPRLVEILESDDEEMRHLKTDVMEILKNAVPETELFDICWRVWEKLIRQVKRNELLPNLVQPIILYLQDAKIKDKNELKFKLYKLLEDPEPIVRKRALDMHHELLPKLQ